MASEENVPYELADCMGIAKLVERTTRRKIIEPESEGRDWGAKGTCCKTTTAAVVVVVVVVNSSTRQLVKQGGNLPSVVSLRRHVSFAKGSGVHASLKTTKADKRDFKGVEKRRVQLKFRLGTSRGRGQKMRS